MTAVLNHSANVFHPESSRCLRVEKKKPDVHMYFGPTNSSKTADALRLLAQADTGVFVAPLRMLALEAYDKLVVMVGEQGVGLVTGEHRINTGARILCCTVECTPPNRDTIVIDEAHWLSDPARGHHWTRVMRQGGYNTYHIIAATEAKPLLSKMFPASDFTVTCTTKQRLSLLDPEVREYAFDRRLDAVHLPAAFVAFSRRSVVAIARALTELGHTPAIIYGAMPPKERTVQLGYLLDCSCDVIVTTDVIGHGINLPIQSVVLCETRKFDGERMRALKVWEGAQICGRAGRGTDASGSVFAGSSLAMGLDPDRDLLAAAVAAANGTTPTDLDLAKAPLMPTLADLGAEGGTCAVLLAAAFEAWASKESGHEWLARPAATTRDSDDNASDIHDSHDIRDIRGRLRWFNRELLNVENCVALLSTGMPSPQTVWDIARAPISEASWEKIARTLLFGDGTFHVAREPGCGTSAFLMEKHVAWINDLRTLSRMRLYSVHCVLPQDLDATYHVAVDDLTPLIREQTRSQVRCIAMHDDAFTDDDDDESDSDACSDDSDNSDDDSFYSN